VAMKRRVVKNDCIQRTPVAEKEG